MEKHSDLLIILKKQRVESFLLGEGELKVEDEKRTMATNRVLYGFWSESFLQGFGSENFHSHK